MTLFVPVEISPLSVNADNTIEDNKKEIKKTYMDELKKLDVMIKAFDFESIGLANDLPENYKSDFLRWHLLGTEGGLFSDINILYFKPMDALALNIKKNSDYDTFLCFQEYHSVGFILSKKDNNLFNYIFSKSKVNFDFFQYQSAGPAVLNNYCQCLKKAEKEFHVTICNMDKNIVYFLDSYQLDDIYNKNSLDKLGHNSIGLHWYAGAKAVRKEYKEFLCNIDADNFKNYDNTITKIIELIL